ncbi:TonB-dependent receptor plug domain-containing protein [Marinicauda sp. Alg238-R41]|uniref:TonB-dependent receptor plug domain-containing protein n=1 Tax=Marinicauda sp. Alg238-R41 TaxID=2993447 RepID=UPI0022E6C028|nr:TonB-dependent receptor [Marinicauda sp. Alg238-R41]
MRTILLAGTAFAALAQPALGQTDTEIQTRPVEDTIIVTGTRGQSRTAIESLAPVDVITADAIDTVVSDELVDSLAALNPAFSVQRLPMADGAIYVRPARLRSLSPDQTLVLVNGKRRHRAALLGRRGAQSADLATVPSFAISRVEVLRDGASAQYGSDAIAGVINIILDETEGLRAFAQTSQYFEGDGQQDQLGAQLGFELGDGGFATATLEYTTAEPTSRSRQRPDAIAFEEATGIQVDDPVQNWGQPEREAVKFAFNAAAPITGAIEFYSHATYAQGQGVSDFNWRNPAFTTAYQTTPLDPDYDLSQIFPAGFSPQFGQEDQDYEVVAGLRGEVLDGLEWDLSAGRGRNEIDYFIYNTINASLGSNSPTSFNAGVLAQEETNFNLDFVYGWDTGRFEAPVSIAFGLEAREETYEIEAGDEASYAVGPLAVEGLPSGSNGFPGYSDLQAGSFSQDSYAGYVDVELPVTEQLTVAGALRYEDFSEFGSTTDYKLSGRFAVTDALAFRGTVSTGFRAPTPGQIESERTSQGLNSTTLVLVTSGRFSPTGPVADIINARANGPQIRPLDAETSQNYSLGMTYSHDSGLTATVDVYQIDVDDRFSTLGSFTLTDAERAQLAALNVPGGESITQVSFFQNQFDTRTRGIDVVATYGFDLGQGAMSVTGAYSYNETEVTGEAASGVFNDVSRTVFEEGLPQHNVVLTADYMLGRFTLNARARYYGEWTDTDDSADVIFQNFGSEVFVDLGLRADINENFAVRVGAENIFDTYPDGSRRQANRGLIYSRNAPYDTDGGKYYLRLEASF